MFANRKPQRSRQQTGKVKTIPAAVGGWNARDSLANMPATDAVSLINWFPKPSRCEIRKGFTQYVTGFAAAVETLGLYEGNTAQNLFAWSGTSIYDASFSGAVGAPVVTGLANARWITVNFTTTGGARYLVCVNSVDFMQAYDGTAWNQITGVSSIAITGVNTSQLGYVTVHKNRLWLIQAASMNAYYMPTGQLGGAASVFPLGGVFKRGGSIIAVETWTVDGGYGMDDNLVFISSMGEIAIYHGTDPSNASTWALMGVYNLGAPIGARCAYKFGGDLLVLTFDGIEPLSQSLESSRVSTASTITDKIEDYLGDQVNSTFGTYGWQFSNSPVENALLLNVPIGGGVFEQYVMNTITGAWTRFQGWNANCWEVWKDRQFFGGPTYVAKAFDGYSDGGSAINTDYFPAFNAFDDEAHLKQWTMARPIFATDGAPGIAYGLNVDFDSNQVANTPTFIASSAGTWDSGVWDAAIWAGGLTLQRSWQFVSGLGYWASFRIRTQTNGVQLQLSSIDYLYKDAGVL